MEKISHRSCFPFQKGCSEGIDDIEGTTLSYAICTLNVIYFICQKQSEVTLNEERETETERNCSIQT